MLLPDNINPELSLFYIGGLVIDSLSKKSKQDLLDLYNSVKKVNKITFSIFLLSLDWLYLMDIAKYNDKGEIELCS